MDAKKYWKFAGISSAQLLAGSIVLPVLAPYFSSLGYSDSWISVVFGLFPLFMLLSAIFVGELSDQVGRSWTIRLAVGATIISYGLYWLGASWSIISGRALDAVSYATLVILLLAKIEDVLDEQTRGRYTGVYLSVKDGVRLIGPLAGGYLADVWIGAPFVTAMVVLAGVVFVLRDANAHQKRAIEVHPLRNLRRFLADTRLRPLLILGPLLNGMLPALTVFLPLLVTKDLGLSYAAVGAATSAYMAGHLTQFFFGDLTDRYGDSVFMVAGAATMSAGLLLVPLFAHSYYSLLALMLLYGVGASAWNVACMSYLSRIGESGGEEGMIVGTYVSVGKVGEALSYLATGALVVFVGYSGVFFVLGLLGLVGAVAAAHLFWHLSSRPASAD